MLRPLGAHHQGKQLYKTAVGSIGFYATAQLSTTSCSQSCFHFTTRSTKGKGKGHPITGHEGPKREKSYSSTLSLTSAQMEWVVKATHRPLYPRERPGYRRLGGPQGRYGQVRKISPPPGFDPPTVQSVGSRYTDWAIPAHSVYHIHIIQG
jgi:hypothetical protein